MSRSYLLALLLGCAMASAPPIHATGPTFVPDATVSGSSLAGWRTLGSATWRVQNGEVIGQAGNDGGGWLMLDRSYQDVGFYASFRCQRDCRTGVLLRAEPTVTGIKGVYLALTETEIGAYSVSLDAQGRELQRERLRTAGGMLRIAPPPVTPAPATAPAGRGGGRGLFGYLQLPMPAGMAAPHVPPAGSLRADDWNDIEIFIDANIVRWFVNDGAVVGAVANDDAGRYGPIGLHAGGTGAVHFKSVAFKDLSLKVAPKEEVSNRFGMQRLSEFFYSWSNAAADFNRDGVLDVTNGPYIYFGPDYTSSREVYIGHTFNPSSQYPYSPSRQFPALLPDSAWVVHADDFTADGWPDVLTTDHTGTAGAVLYVNPRGEARRWDRVTVVSPIQTEITLLRDVDGDGRMELVYAADGYIRYAEPDPDNVGGPWIVHTISERGPWGGGHGLGAGDITGDGRMDIVGAWGWWEQPGSGPTGVTWTYHPEPFAKWDRSLPGGGTMAVYDVNGDTHNDIVTGLQAHGFGLAWFEQKRDATGVISFARHTIMGDFSTSNAGGVTFSELHGATSADIDGDSVPDFIVGKRYWAHQDSYYDPDPYGPAVLYWYRTVRNPRAPGGAEFVPNLIHNRSGVGSDVLATDLNGDGAIDIVTTTNRGTFVFWGKGG